MKNLIFFSLFLSLISCNSVEKFRPGIEALSSSWDATTATALQLSEMFGAEQNSFASMVAAMVPDEAKMKKLPAEAQTEITNAIAACQASGSEFTSLGSGIQSFIAEWTAKSAALESLKSGLAAGKIEGDVQAQITDLTSFITDGEAKLTGFSDTLNAIKSSVASNHGNYMGLVEKYLSK